MPRKPTCLCGQCPKCAHRKFVREARAAAKQRRIAAGFTGHIYEDKSEWMRQRMAEKRMRQVIAQARLARDAKRQKAVESQ